jgi:hypothetical protein
MSKNEKQKPTHPKKNKKKTSRALFRPNQVEILVEDELRIWSNTAYKDDFDIVLNSILLSVVDPRP